MAKTLLQIRFSFQQSKVKSALYFQKRQFSVGFISRNKNLPWIQVKKDVFKPDPIVHRLVGMFMFQRVLKYTKTKFDVKEFKRGVKNAIQVVAECMNTQDHENRLESMLGETLHHHVHASFEEMKANPTKMYLNVGPVRDLRITGARFVFGEAEPGDEHVMDTLGQRIIMSKSEMEEFDEQLEGETMAAGFRFGKYFSQKAIQTRIRYQIDVVFKSEEILLYYNRNGDDEIPEEEVSSTKPCICFHKWKFETPIYRGASSSLDSGDDGELNSGYIYPLDWTIIDFNDYLKERYEASEDNDD